MLQNYAVIGMMLITAVLMGSVLLGLGHLVRVNRPNPAKLQPYESGVPDVEPPTARYTPRFYVVAMLFVIFDIEAVFIFPWAVIFDELGLYGFVEMVSFIGLLFAGYIYAWKKGALEWV